MRDSPVTKVPLDNKPRHSGTRIPLNRTAKPSRYSMGRKSHIVPGVNLTHFLIDRDKKKTRECPVPSLVYQWSKHNILYIAGPKPGFRHCPGHGWAWDGTASLKDFCPRDLSPKAQNPGTVPTILSQSQESQGFVSHGTTFEQPE